MKPHHGILRIGRVARWQRWWSYGLLGGCAITGIVWFIGLDAYDLPPSKLVLWWIGHGVTGFLTMMVIGAALPQHVVATWRHHRNRWFGAIALAALSVIAASALTMLYGAESWHVPSHWIHIGVGIFALLAFPWHVVKGRRSIAKAAPRPVQRPD
jgi:hypothetical protein